MSQHDYNLANQTRTSFRTDLNAALSAIVSANSGATEPTTTFAYQLWADTTTGILKQRNVANSGWISLWTIANGPLDKATANTVLAALNLAKGSDVASAATTNIWAVDGNLVHVTGTTGITSLGTAAQAGASRTVIFDGVVTLTHNASTLVLPGGSNYTTVAGEVIEFIADTTAKIVMKSKSSLASTDTKIAFSVSLSSSMTISPSAVTQIQFNTEAYDIGGCFASYKFTPTIADVYSINLNGTMAQAVAGRFSLFIRKNGSNVSGAAIQTVSDMSQNLINTSIDVYLNGTTDYVDFTVFQTYSPGCLFGGTYVSATGHRTYAY